jgi:hypothetical protein
MMRVWVGVLLTVSVLGSEACGGSSDPTRPAVGVKFQREALAVCRAALAQKHAEGHFPYPDFNPTQPDPSEFPGVARFFTKAVTTYSTWLQRMRALGQPPAGRRAWADLLDGINTQLHLHEDQRAAALRGDARTFASDYQKGLQATEAVQHAADAAGVSACVSVVTTAA